MYVYNYVQKHNCMHACMYVCTVCIGLLTSCSTCNNAKATSLIWSGGNFSLVDETKTKNVGAEHTTTTTNTNTATTTNTITNTLKPGNVQLRVNDVEHVLRVRCYQSVIRSLPKQLFIHAYIYTYIYIHTCIHTQL